MPKPVVAVATVHPHWIDAELWRWVATKDAERQRTVARFAVKQEARKDTARNAKKETAE
jgi:hypothetical protein